MTRLFLLKPDFKDSKIDNEGKSYFCPQCAMIAGIIKYYPQLETGIEIYYVDFKRPRNVIIDLIGEDNQSCPVLVIDNHQEDCVDLSYFNSYGDKLFINSTDLIAKYLSEKYGIGILHP
ncbi:MAG TPA: DUF3088 family protein [Draconibacterium sp.]|jgi:hypothetical protein|nr:DUF3088 family protein [Draconibacterium sp.]